MLKAVPIDERSYEFGQFVVSARRRILLREKTPVRLGSRAMDILLALLDSAGSVVSKDDLMSRVWPDTVVDEAAMRVHLSALRKALGDGVAGQRFIINVPQRGYVFTAPLKTDAAASTAFDAPSSVEHRTSSTRLAHMVGRASVVDELAERVLFRKCITIVGAGGIGKTTVAQALVERIESRYPGGAVIVELAALSDPQLVPFSLAKALGVAVPAADPFPTLVAALNGKRMLIVLDNCEHVIDATAQLAERICVSLPDIDLINTSREPLRIRSESIHHLGSLAVPPSADGLSASSALTYGAVQLFVARCDTCFDGFTLGDADVPTVVEICRRLDGIPLALELAAGRVDQFGLSGLATILGDRLGLLTRGMRNGAPRHRTLKETIDWSYRLLTAQEQQVFNHLGVFQESFEAQAANAICGFNVIEILSDLTAKSMLAVTVNEDSIYFRMLYVTRVYAWDSLVESGEAELVRRRQVEFLHELAIKSENDWRILKPADWTARYRHTLDDIRSAVEWCFGGSGDVVAGARLTLATQRLFCQLSLMEDYVCRVEAALRAMSTHRCADPSTETRLNAVLATLLMHTSGMTNRTCRAFERALQLALDSDSDELKALAYSGMWFASVFKSDYKKTSEWLNWFGGVASHERQNRFMFERMLATTLMFEGKFVECLSLSQKIVEESQSGSRGVHDSAMLSDSNVSMYCNQARCLWLTGHADQALLVTRTTVALTKDANAASLCFALANGAIPVALHVGDLALANEWAALLTEKGNAHGLGYWNDWGKFYLSFLSATGRASNSLSSAGTDRPLGFELLSILRITDVATMSDLALVESHSWCAPEILRYEALACLESGTDPEVARALLAKSILFARHQRAVAWELRASRDLAVLYHNNGETDRALQLLGPIYESFTEGYGTADLVRARETLYDMGYAPAITKERLA